MNISSISDCDNDLYDIFIHDIPLMDVRAPVEFDQGSFPTASNIPLLDDEQRHEIGLKYKNEGQDKAIELGLELISGSIKEQRIQDWSNFKQNYPNAKLYCFRGGLRSRTTQQWLKEQGVEIELIPGGYKRMRRYLLDVIEHWAENVCVFPNTISGTSANKESEQLIMLAGRTGTGKTKLLNSCTNSIDLEGLANHRGSSFGHYVTPQPSQIDFENRIASNYLKLHSQNIKRIVLEDEGRLIGRLTIPESLYIKMKQSAMILVESSVEQRVEITLNDYIISNYNDFIKAYPEDGQERFSDYLQSSLSRIQKRLGGINYKKLQELMKQALDAQFKTGDIDLHRQWIKSLMVDYYDPMYDYQLEKKQERIIFRGNESAISEWLTNN